MLKKLKLNLSVSKKMAATKVSFRIVTAAPLCIGEGRHLPISIILKHSEIRKRNSLASTIVRNEVLTASQQQLSAGTL